MNTKALLETYRDAGKTVVPQEISIDEVLDAIDNAYSEGFNACYAQVEPMVEEKAALMDLIDGWDEEDEIEEVASWLEAPILTEDQDRELTQSCARNNLGA